MCVYCNMGDRAFKWDPPWNPDVWPAPYKPSPSIVPDPWVNPNPFPTIPKPAPGVEVKPWNVEKLRDYLELLKEIKALEDQIGCPCEPNKADYIGLFEKRIAELEKKVNRKKKK